MHRLAPAALLLVILGSPVHARADTPPDRDAGAHPAGSQPAKQPLRPGFGFRVGGYGFRDHDGSQAWNDCRMNGAGVFGTLDLTTHFFTELSVDFYQATPGELQKGMDRISDHVLAAAGLRMFPAAVVTPYVQLGGGAEWTRVSVGESSRAGLLPVAFIGLGAEVNVTRELRLGANLRVLATSEPGEASETAQAPEAPTLHASAAAQGQLVARYAL